MVHQDIQQKNKKTNRHYYNLKENTASGFFLDISASGGAQVARTDEQSSFNLVKLPTDHSQSRQVFNIVNLVSCFFCDLRHMRCFTIFIVKVGLGKDSEASEPYRREKKAGLQTCSRE